MHQVTFPNARRSYKDRIVSLAIEVAGGHIEDLFASDRRVEFEVEIVEALLVSKRASGNLTKLHKFRFVFKSIFVLRDSFSSG